MDFGGHGYFSGHVDVVLCLLMVLAGFLLGQCEECLDAFFGYCFGVWERWLGTITPLQALYLDVVLLCLAVVILLFYPAGFLSFRPWFIKQKGLVEG